ncbi:MAG TPA: ferritin-like domain-containing protein, partial [Gammaproteobacteria bacterium]|nr:ferritin-like domain-containing protein [Gammaproteobacteria bacterium]
PTAEEMIKQLLKDHDILSDHAGIILTKAQKAQDEGTVDLLIERLREHEKTAWMLKSSLNQK